jgi:hypothetical protein
VRTSNREKEMENQEKNAENRQTTNDRMTSWEQQRNKQSGSRRPYYYGSPGDNHFSPFFHLNVISFKVSNTLPLFSHMLPSGTSISDLNSQIFQSRACFCSVAWPALTKNSLFYKVRSKPFCQCSQASFGWKRLWSPCSTAVPRA